MARVHRAGARKGLGMLRPRSYFRLRALPGARFVLEHRPIARGHPGFDVRPQEEFHATLIDSADRRTGSRLEWTRHLSGAGKGSLRPTDPSDREWDAGDVLRRASE